MIGRLEDKMNGTSDALLPGMWRREYLVFCLEQLPGWYSSAKVLKHEFIKTDCWTPLPGLLIAG